MLLVQLQRHRHAIFYKQRNRRTAFRGFQNGGAFGEGQKFAEEICPLSLQGRTPGRSVWRAETAPFHCLRAFIRQGDFAARRADVGTGWREHAENRLLAGAGRVRRENHIGDHP